MLKRPPVIYRPGTESAAGRQIHGPWGFNACPECAQLVDAYIVALDRHNQANRRFLQAIMDRKTAVIRDALEAGRDSIAALRSAASELHHHRVVKGC
jgi:hypothetical protein